MLVDLRKYTTNDVDLCDEIRFFKMICERCIDKKFVKMVLDNIAAGIDDALDLKDTSDWITDMYCDIDWEDYFNIEYPIVKLVLNCFKGYFDYAIHNDYATYVYVYHRNRMRNFLGEKKLHGKYNKEIDVLLSNLDYIFSEIYNKEISLEEFKNEYDDTYLYYNEYYIKSMNKCEDYDLLSEILEELGFEHVSSKEFVAAYISDMSYYDALCITDKLFTLLDLIPVINDVSRWNYLFELMDFESRHNNYLFRKLTSMTFDRKDVIF